MAQVERIRAVHPADLVDVAKALGGDERHFRAAALDHGVDGDGRAVQEEAGVCQIGAGLLHAVGDAIDQPAGRGERFAEQQLARAFVEGGDIGKRAADVGGDAQASAFSLPHGRRSPE
jgi:hypothetical protein